MPNVDYGTRAQDALLVPKADLHVHAETDARLDRLLARQEGRSPYDWSRWAARLQSETPPGIARLERLARDRCRDPATVDALDAFPETFVARVVDLLMEGAADGAVLIEVLFGRSTLEYQDFLSLFREAERAVQQRYPRLRAEAVLSGVWPPRDDPDGNLLRSCITAAGHGLAGLDLIPAPYDTEADWRTVDKWVARAVDAGLGVTAHVGEFSPANIAAALRLPGIRRLGQAVYAATNPQLLGRVARSGFTIECALTCNVVLGAVPSYEEHPIRQFMSWDIPVALATDDPVRVRTSIGREYAVAAGLGFTTRTWRLSHAMPLMLPLFPKNVGPNSLRTFVSENLELLSKPPDGVADLGDEQAPGQRRVVGPRRPATATRAAQAQGRPTACV